MNDVLDNKIQDVLDEADRMFIATSVGGNSSGASVFFNRDGDDLIFFTFNPTRKAEQIRRKGEFINKSLEKLFDEKLSGDDNKSSTGEKEALNDLLGGQPNDLQKTSLKQSSLNWG